MFFIRYCTVKTNCRMNLKFLAAAYLPETLSVIHLCVYVTLAIHCAVAFSLRVHALTKSYCFGHRSKLLSTCDRFSGVKFAVLNQNMMVLVWKTGWSRY